MSMNWLSPLVLAGIFCGFFSLPQLHADDFVGAAALAAKLNNAVKKPPVVPVTGDDTAHVARDLATFAKTVDSLASDDAAKQWLALCNRTLRLGDDVSQTMFSNGTLQAVFQALPGPQAWPEIEKLVGAEPPPSKEKAWQHNLLLLMLHTLNNEEDQQWADLTALQTIADDSLAANADVMQLPLVLAVGSKLSSVSNEPVQVEKFWNRILGELKKSSTNPNASFEGNTYEFPDLITLLGVEKAQPLILQALLLPHLTFTFAGKATSDAARKLALANIDKLQQAPWPLTETLEASDLYDALVRKFGTPDNQPGTVYHVLALVVQGKSQEAVKATENLNGASLGDAVTKAAKAGYGLQVYDFLQALLQEYPEGPYWKSYVQLAAQTGHAEDALKFVQDSLARKDLSDVARMNLEEQLFRALLAVDKVDEGIKQLRALIQKAKAAPANTSGDVSPSGDSKIVEWDIELARLGRLLKQEALENEGLADAKLRGPSDVLTMYLIETGRNVEAEKILIDAIVAEQARQQVKPQNRGFGDLSFLASRPNLVRLAQVYYNAGRWADILTLLEKVPGWGSADLVEIVPEKAFSERYTPTSVGLMAARALSETGRMDEARKGLDYTLQVDAGDDAAYELLLKIGQGDLVAKLDALYQQDQFQNRPLIWKATALLQQGKVAEAEATCKAAIAVDPSDGETGKGNRMRVYSVMAEVCTAKKDATQAAFFQNVVKAIRLSENADDFYDAGLLTRAVKMYAQALDLFSDAYCIQSRIARQLAELGRLDEAAIHYRKAFELMPVSFGRMESHCFGCEGAFQGKTATSIAEKTFTDLLAKDPKKPQLHYLLGYLYMEEQDYPKAVVNLQKAAELDPDYINAWKQIAEIGQSYQLSASLRDAAAFNILRLDPAGRHINPDTQGVRDLTKLWNAEAASLVVVPPPPATLLPLPASAAQLAESKEQWKKMIPPGFDPAIIQLYENQIARAYGAPKDANAPRTAVLGNGVISTALGLFR